MDMKYTTAILDMDGVIIDSEDIWSSATEKFLEERGIIYEPDQVRPMLLGKSGLDSMKILKNYYHLHGSVEELKAERQTLVEEYYMNSLQFVDGFLDFYQRLVDLGIKKCVATATDPSVVTVVDQLLNIAQMFDNNIFQIADIGYKSKPDPAIFIHAACKMNSDVTECFVIDHSENGVTAAKSAHMFAIALTTKTERDQLKNADMIVNSFAEIDLEHL